MRTIKTVQRPQLRGLVAEMSFAIYKELMAEKHWGKWVNARRRFLGIVRQKDFAKAIGCSVDQLARWSQMERPPATMMKGFDNTLAIALKIDRQMLFREWKDFHPEKATIIGGNRDNSAPWFAEKGGEEKVRQELVNVIFALSGSELVHLYAIIVHAFQGKIGTNDEIFKIMEASR